jgi:hypothetical protein
LRQRQRDAGGMNVHPPEDSHHNRCTIYIFYLVGKAQSLPPLFQSQPAGGRSREGGFAF